MLQRALTALVVVAGVILGAAAANAAVVNYSFSGVIDAPSDPSLPGEFQSGQTFSGSYSVDSTALPDLPNNGEQFVYHGLESFSVTFGSFTATKTGSPGDEIQVDVTGPILGLTDRYAVVARGVTGPPIAGGFTFGDIFSFRLDGTNVFPASTGMNTTPPLPTDISLSKFNGLLPVDVFFSFVPPTGGDSISGSGHLTALDQTNPIPEPGSLALLAIGMTICGGAWARRRRSAAA